LPVWCEVIWASRQLGDKPWQQQRPTKRKKWDDWVTTYALGLGLDLYMVIFVVQMTFAQLACRADDWRPQI